MAARLVKTIALAVAFSWHTAVVLGGITVQVPGLTVPASSASNKQKVVDVFTTSWDAYKFVLLVDDATHLTSVLQGVCVWARRSDSCQHELRR